MSASHQIYIVRHGNTFDRGDVVTRVGGRTDLALSKSGQAQAAALAAYFKQQGIVLDEIYSSPLRRTMQTAQAIAAQQPNVLKVRPVAFLREIDYGPDENRPEAEVVARIGQAALDAWEADAIVPDGWQVDPEGLIHAWSEFLAKLARPATPKTSLIVTSNGIARFALKALGDKAASDHALKLATGALGRLELNADGAFNVAVWNIRP
ncbi:MAG: histidine phosphatase family protein [Henriciella sp.]|nr:histidine phosphatase family protein [Henriciella sp.]